MEVSLRGLGTTVQNPDGTISVVIDPNAGNIAPTPAPTPNQINYNALGVDPVVADGQGGLCLSSQLVNNLCPAGESCAVTGDCYVPSTGTGTSAPSASGGCPTGQVLSNGLCVPAFAGIPTTTLLYVAVGYFLFLAFMKGGK